MIKKIILSIFYCVTMINSYSQFTDIFWERRSIYDSIGSNSENGIGVEVKSGEYEAIKLYEEQKYTFGDGVIIKSAPNYSDEKLFERVYDVKIDSSGNYNLNNFITIEYKFLNERDDFYIDATIIDHNKYTSLYMEDYPSGDIITYKYHGVDGDTISGIVGWNPYKKIDSSQYIFEKKIPIHFYQYDFVKSHHSSYQDPVESSKKTLSYGKFVFKHEEYIYTIYWPLTND